MRNWSTEKLFRLLESAHDRVVAEAMEVLESRGIQPQHLELAMALARGSREERLQGLETLKSDESLQPLPWLVWMAQCDDHEVRLRAIAMLGSMPDEEALRKLRLLKQRENDHRVAERITHVLLSAGAARTGTR
jgi:hypothetical protein